MTNQYLTYDTTLRLNEVFLVDLESAEDLASTVQQVLDYSECVTLDLTISKVATTAYLNHFDKTFPQHRLERIFIEKNDRAKETWLIIKRKLKEGN